MPFCKINVYHDGENIPHEFEIPGRVTVTGRENHYDRAYEDACMILKGMQAASPEDARVSILSVSMERY